MDSRYYVSSPIDPNGFAGSYHPSFVLQPSAQAFTQLLNAPHDQITDYSWNQPQGNITDDTMDKSSSHSLDQPTDEPSMSQSANHVTSDARLTLTPDQSHGQSILRQ